ncbi:MAG TPA: hypothetical protein VKK79_18645 [Candidatus Lokiarchaeia archaeon]|nr:hypothetical protein [Candidatus Lokiarchaeia archaeon]
MVHIKPSTVVKVKKIFIGILLCAAHALNMFNGKVSSAENIGNVYRELFPEIQVKHVAAEVASKGKMLVATHA